MSITAASFRKDFPQEFGDESRYPNSEINYWLAIAGLMLNPKFFGVSPPTASNPPTAIIDFATELFVAHNIVLAKQAVDAAIRGGDPGTKMGMIASKSVGGVSVSLDVGAVSEADGGYWNQTSYGLRLKRMFKYWGAGPVQIGIGRPPLPFLTFSGELSNAWAGPYPGVQPSDSGFG